MNNTAILILTYLREKNIEEILEKAEKSKLNIFIFHDYYNEKDLNKKNKNLKIKKKLLKISKRDRFNVYIRKKNYGLRKNYLSSMKHIFDLKYESLIYLEDDIIPKDNFFKNMLFLLRRYKNNEKIVSVAGSNLNIDIENANYKYDIFFSRNPNSYGMGIWKNKWLNFYNQLSLEHDGLLNHKRSCEFIKKNFFYIYAILRSNKLGFNQSIGVFWAWYIISNKFICVNTSQNFIVHRGYDGLGTNLGFKKVNPDKKLPKDLGSLPNVFFDKNVIKILKESLKSGKYEKMIFNIQSDIILKIILKLIKLKNKIIKFF